MSSTVSRAIQYSWFMPRPGECPTLRARGYMETRHDLRREAREACTPAVKIMWCDVSGADKYANATAIDVSPQGMRLKVPEPLRIQSSVTLCSEKLKLHGEASVRHCSRFGTSYSIGLEFMRGVRWNPKKG